MADYITSTSASLHSSPSRKRTRESHTTRSSSNSSSHKTATSVTSNLEAMDSSTSEITASLPSSTQPQGHIFSDQNDPSSVTSNDTISNGIAGSSSGIQNQAPITVNIIILHFHTFRQIKFEVPNI